MVVGIDAPCIGNVSCQLDSIHHVNHAFVEPQCKHPQVDITEGKHDPLRAQRVASDRRTELTIGVRKDTHGAAIVINDPVIPGGLEVPLRDRESWKITTARQCT